MKGYMYILECANGKYYTGSTIDLERRLAQHQSGEGANFTKKHLPVKLVYFEEYQRISDVFYREKQVQGWSRKKKEALINGRFDTLSDLSKNYTQFPREVASTSSATTSSATTSSATTSSATTSSATTSSATTSSASTSSATTSSASTSSATTSSGNDTWH
ncbi:MAG: GIY-YIG nuclease family protein [Lentimicrobiaceae bacterium]|nr:GIY-YIG nuclease family protein [Lentimicrobiaceae bacterium]